MTSTPLLAHKAYYEAGVLHGHISNQVIMRVPDPSSPCDSKGILLDLEHPLSWRKGGRAPPEDSSDNRNNDKKAQPNVQGGNETTANVVARPKE